MKGDDFILGVANWPSFQKQLGSLEVGEQSLVNIIFSPDT